jgi:transcriptional regulator with XRE-family HTH domain
VGDFYEEFGSNLRAARKRAGLTQRELADRINLTRTSVTNIERGTQRIALHQLFDLAAAVGDKPVDLLPALQPNLRDLLSDQDLNEMSGGEQEREFVASILRKSPGLRAQRDRDER